MKNEYEIRGEVTAIFLKRKSGEILETIIDTKDLEKAKEYPFTWYAALEPRTNSFYVQGNSSYKEGKRTTVILHRWILGEPKNLVIDHINHDTLNNTRKNLRSVTHAQNTQNKKGNPKNNTSGFRGVTWHKGKKRWDARISLNNKRIHVGTFKNKDDAIKAVIEARKNHYPFCKEAREVI